MKSPLPLLAIGAAFLLMRGKKGSGSEEVKDNVLEITATSGIPMLKGPYIQLTSSYTLEIFTLGDLEDIVRPIAEQNLDVKFVIAAADGIDRLKVSQHADLSTPDQLVILAMHGEGEVPLIEIVEGPDATLTEVEELVRAAVEYLKAPSSNG